MTTFSDSAYKRVTVSRGLDYQYYYHPADPSKPTLLFTHGFPSTSYDWRIQAAFFGGEGYGLIIPDMLGYGGTAKPSVVTAYKASLICKDMIDILDAESISNCIAIGHDWGTKITSRLSNYYPDRFTAFAFLAMPYLAPSPQFDMEEVLATTKKMVGYELYGYWKFLSEDGADKIIEDHWDSFIDLLWPENPKLWITDLGPSGALKAWLLADKRTPIAPYITELDKTHQKETLLKDGISAPLNWYKTMTHGVSAEDDKSAPLDTYKLTKPVFFAGAKQDYVCPSELGKAATAKNCTDATIREYDAGHWVMLSNAAELNEDLRAWIEGLKTKNLP